MTGKNTNNYPWPKLNNAEGSFTIRPATGGYVQNMIDAIIARETEELVIREEAFKEFLPIIPYEAFKELFPKTPYDDKNLWRKIK
ncbi:MAG TPA: hypothetical protein VJB94_01020 [Candidatus Nanoarchaeia archaeon]|nr:hypothetical protein [Candidatus Nanoarchaeia archaeon]